VSERVRESFARQGAMSLIGARLADVGAGTVTITLQYRPEVGQQHGFFHGGIIATVLDSACGYAALTTMDADAAVLTVEFKTIFLAPAAGTALRAAGRVRKAGRTLVFCEASAFVASPRGEREVATMTATMMAVRREGLTG
jgi:uncharacterized protein (TIGR00369 family)